MRVRGRAVEKTGLTVGRLQKLWYGPLKMVVGDNQALILERWGV